MQESKLGALEVAAMIVVFLIALQSCLQSRDPQASTDLQILQAGRQQLRQQAAPRAPLQILQERIIRPGRQGATFGYEARYRGTAEDGSRQLFYHYAE